MIDVPETRHDQSERGPLAAPGRRTDNGRTCDLLVVHEVDGSWTVHAPGEPGVTLSRANTIALADSILARAR